jgi:MFS family permease
MESGAPSGPRRTGPPRLLRALQHRNYRLYFGGQAASLIGMWMQFTAQSWLMYRLTESSAAVGILAAAQTGPGLVLGPLAGALADRHDKRRLMMASLGASMVPALVLAIITVLGWVVPWHLVALTLITGLARAFEIPTRHAFIPDLVDRDDLHNAIALNSVLFNISRLIGPVLAGVVIELWNEGWCFMVNAVSYVGILGALSALRLRAHVPQLERRTSLFAEIREGVRYIRSHPVLLALLGILGISSFAGMPYGVLLPSFARETLGGDASTYTTLSAVTAVGAIAGALLLAARAGSRGLERWVLGAALLFGLGLVVFSRTTGLLFALPIVVFVGAGSMVLMTSTNTMLMLTVPDELRGRVMSLHTALFLGILPVGGVVLGTLADRMGVAPVLAMGGATVVVGALVAGRVLLRHTRREGG